MATVELDKINKLYENGFHAVQDLSINVDDGEFLVLVGPSGCGKSTALRMVAGLEDISTGELRIGGRRVNDVDPQGRDIAMVFQSYALYPHMSVADNMAYGLKLRKMPKDEMNARVKKAADMLELTPLLDRKPEAALRWPAAAGGDGPLDRPRAAGLPDGRAALQPRRQAARADARRDLGRRTVAEHHDPVRHARPDRGHDDGRPDGRAQGRHPPAARHPRRLLRQSQQHLRRPVRRLAADEPGDGHDQPGQRRRARRWSSAGRSCRSRPRSSPSGRR